MNGRFCCFSSLRTTTSGDVVSSIFRRLSILDIKPLMLDWKMVSLNCLLVCFPLRVLVHTFDSDCCMFTLDCSLPAEIFFVALCLQHSESVGLKNEAVQMVNFGWWRMGLEGFQAQSLGCAKKNSSMLQRVVD